MLSIFEFQSILMEGSQILNMIQGIIARRHNLIAIIIMHLIRLISVKDPKVGVISKISIKLI